MKKVMILFVLLALFALGIVGVSLLYEKLSSSFASDNLQSVQLPENSGSKEEETENENSEPEIEKNTAPDFKVLTADGKEVSLSDYFGTPIVINFWATWCVYCKEEMPDFDRAAKEYTNVTFMMVNVGESIETGKAYAEGEGFSLELFFDMDYEAASAYGVTGYPMTFFISEDGNVVTYARGKINYQTRVKGISTITE